MSQVAMDCIPKASLSTRVETDTFKYLHALYSQCVEGDILFVTEYDSGAKKVAACFPVSEIGKAAEFVEKFKGTNLFLKINAMDHRATIRKRPYGIGGNDEVKAVVSIHLDVDAGKDDRYLTPDKMLEALAKMPLEPSMIVQTNGDEGGFHAYWLLDCPKYLETLEGGQEEISDQGEAERNQCQVVANSWLRKLREFAKPSLIDGTADLCRFLRPVGSKRKSGNTVRFYSFKPENRYSFEQFIIPESASVAPVSKTTSYPSMLSEDDRVITRYLKERNLYSVEAILQQQGYSKHSQKGKFWIRPGSTSGQPTGEIYFNNGQEGFTVKSGAADPLCNTNGSGSNGNWYSIESLFVSFHTGRDASHGRNPDAWQDAAAFCHDYFESQMPFADTSRIVCQAEAAARSATPEKRPAADHLYHAPGFIHDVMELTMTSAPYPNRRLAFAGAISLLAMLTGRRVTFQNLGLNLYILALASSGSGKDAPRKVNDEILQQCGILGSIGDSIASGGGLEDAVFQSPQLLLQVDEFDGLVRAMADEREQRFASTMVNLLRFYTASNSRYHRRMKSGEEQRSVLRPALNLFATCTPASFFESVNNRLLRNGLMARILVIDAGKRGTGQRPKPIEVDESLRMQVDFWKQCGIYPDQNLTSVNPICKEIEAGSGALEVLDDLRSQADRHYAAREAKRDEAGMAIWARAYEIAIKLAGLYACSTDCENPIVQVEATRWASEFVLHHVAEMLKLVESEVVETPFDRLCQRILKRLERGPVGHSDLLRYAGVDTRDFNQAMETLYQRDQVLATEQESPGRKAKRIYFLADQSSESSVKFGTSSELCK